MSLFDFLSGTKEIETEQQATQSTQQSKQGTGFRTGSQFGRGTTDESATTTGARTGTQTLLDARTLETLRSMIPGLAGRAGASTGGSPFDIGGEIDLASFAVDRAKDTDAFVADLAPKLEEKLRADFARNVLPVIAGRGNVIGSNDNTYTRELTAQANSDLEAQIGSVIANLELEGRKLGSQDLLQAFGMTSQAGSDARGEGTQDIANLASIVSLIRGSEVTSSEDTRQNIIRELENLTGQTTAEESQQLEEIFGSTSSLTNQQTEQGASVLDFLNAFANFSSGLRRRV